MTRRGYLSENAAKIDLASGARFPTTRLQRLRSHPALRDLIRDVSLATTDLIYPLFVTHGQGVKRPIASMPGCYQFSVDQLADEISDITTLGIQAVMLFGLPETKDPEGRSACQADGIVQQAIRTIKDQAPSLLVIADVCFCEYTSHGHCGVLTETASGAIIDNDKTLVALAEQAISLGQAGADVLAPSGMTDGMVAAIRAGLDAANLSALPILSYAVKYASAFYGPFRDAAQGAPQFGDRKSYQMDPANRFEALREVELDVAEGADMIMVKPALAYLDVIARVKQHLPQVPLCAYQVSGEYAMLKAAHAKGWLDERAAALESLIAIKRAGADFIITYYAKQVASWLV